jgi:hypothetical protein
MREEFQLLLILFVKTQSSISICDDKAGERIETGEPNGAKVEKILMEIMPEETPKLLVNVLLLRVTDGESEDERDEELAKRIMSTALPPPFSELSELSMLLVCVIVKP